MLSLQVSRLPGMLQLQPYFPPFGAFLRLIWSTHPHDGSD